MNSTYFGCIAALLIGLVAAAQFAAQKLGVEMPICAAVCALLDNALHASAAAGTNEPIEVAVERDGKGLLVCVEDAGAGVAPHLQGRLGEPFLTTKQPGEGMGLGLYLVRTLLEQAGGRLEVSAREPRGTRVTLRLAEAGA